MIWALSRGVTSGDRPVRGRAAGFRIRSSVPRMLPACPSGSATSSLTLTICPLWPALARSGPLLDAGAGLDGPVRARERDRHRDRRERTRRHVLHAGHRSQDGQEPGTY
jgi:hypothetical protein